MKNKVSQSLLLFVLFLVFSAAAFGVNFLLTQQGITVSYKLHFLFFFLHFLSLASIIGVSLIKKELIAYVYVAFLIVKMGGVIFLAYKFPEMKQNLMLYFGFYWYYLLVETALVVALIRIQDKNHKINKSDTL
ncbi:hypothetical protein OZ668_01180 [Elizabethkingia sp. HX XZB]|jgi:hypothetical protein|uniref:hypothetical protein n=1 Tax=Elizabethkingia sp. HX XZB TaxID=3003193 RepID=UPI00282BE402|nr:hypothetical protein [Elizabethkingia sp. HX XZB]MDR2229482.1 hypothetical protein [Flavobacteriaceae bacterium]MDX8566580.1 hypothetical protein [Elizabethkingia sp. HX XZB]